MPERASANTVGWGEVAFRSLPALTAVAATILVMENPGPWTVFLQVACGVVTLMAWLPFDRKQVV